MTLHALYSGGAAYDLTCGYTWQIPKMQRGGTLQYTPYGPPWDDGQDELGAVQSRASPSSLTLHVAGRNPTEAADNAELWTGRVLSATRLIFLPTGRFMQILRAASVDERDPVRGTYYVLKFDLDYKNPFWHNVEGDGSTRLHP